MTGSGATCCGCAAPASCPATAIPAWYSATSSRAMAIPGARLGLPAPELRLRTPGEVHTLVVPADCPEMITFFNITGAMIYVDDANRQTGYEDVFTKIGMCRAHYSECGLGAGFVDQFIR